MINDVKRISNSHHLSDQKGILMQKQNPLAQKISKGVSFKEEISVCASDEFSAVVDAELLIRSSVNSCSSTDDLACEMVSSCEVCRDDVGVKRKRKGSQSLDEDEKGGGRLNYDKRDDIENNEGDGNIITYDIGTLLRISTICVFPARPSKLPVVEGVTCAIHHNNVHCPLSPAIEQHIEDLREYHSREEANQCCELNKHQDVEEQQDYVERNLAIEVEETCIPTTKRRGSQNPKHPRLPKHSSSILEISGMLNPDEPVQSEGHATRRRLHPEPMVSTIDYNMILKWNLVKVPDDLVVDLLPVKKKLVQLLNKATMSEDMVHELVLLFSKVVKCRRRHNLMSVLSVLKDSMFVLKHVPGQILCLARNGEEEKGMTFCDAMMGIMSEYFTCFPTSFTNMPLDTLVMVVSNMKNKEVLEGKIGPLLQQREDLLRKTLLMELEKEKLENKPPNNFRHLSTFPTSEDILAKEKPFLRPAKRIGCYDDEEHYLDVQYRLLREDLIAPLRDGIREFIHNIPTTQRKSSLKVYRNVRILHANCTNHGLTYRIMFDTKEFQPDLWKYSKRLIFGSLVCLSKDSFESMIFATVADRNQDELTQGLVDIRFNERTEAEKYCHENTPMVMVEAPSYFEAYKHILQGMKEVTSFAMRDYIVKCKAAVKPPSYLRNDKEVKYDLRGCQNKLIDVAPSNLHCVPILKQYMWPDAKYTSLNEMQFKALMHALTEEFTVIQGPPGTGKTYVGLHIANTLLVNKRLWNNEGRVPMLLVTYTNHALDQFLKGLIYLGHTNIIRVGGRSCEELKMFNLKNAVQDQRYTGDNKHLQNAKDAAYKEKETITRDISPYVDGLKTLYNNMVGGKLLSYEVLINIIHPQHQQYMATWAHQLSQLNIPVFDVFLGLCDIDIDNMADIKAVEEEKPWNDDDEVEECGSVDETIDIKGEGDILMDRWVTDMTTYKPLEYFDLPSSNHDEMRALKNIAILDRNGAKIRQPSNAERKKLIKVGMMAEEMRGSEVRDVIDPWQLDIQARWRLYKYWLKIFTRRYTDFIMQKTEQYEHACANINELHEQEEEMVLRHADVIAMTTTCAARYRTCLSSIRPKIVIIEEAAEVLEAHVVASLSEGVEHVVLIGDHKQLQPNPAVYELAKKYSLEVSLFERMINNGIQYHVLNVQHRMRPSIAQLVLHIYPRLLSHKSLNDLPSVQGLYHNLAFVNHYNQETEIKQIKSKANTHEAQFLRSLCLYLLQQGYKRSQITVLTGYTGQLMAFKRMMSRAQFEGVRVTALDNYQGEENDIVLLSLVRSNTEGKLGFMRTESRISVALSRAKIGLYVIGNLELFESGSDLWRRIIQGARAMGLVKDYLELCCQNHPDTITEVKYASDFHQAPEGGCTRSCDFRLNCGHACQMACHPTDLDHEDYVCSKLCELPLPCGHHHTCGSICHHEKPCEPCRYPVTRTLPRCGHRQMMECSADVQTFVCQDNCSKLLSCGHTCKGVCGEECGLYPCKQKVVKKLSSCGHRMSLSCHVNTVNAVCTAPCNSELQCSHQCPGTCGDCKGGRMHVKCAHKCGRLLVCSHVCTVPCTSECPPCRKKCENRCEHSVCAKLCGEICNPCQEPCNWVCRHYKCTTRCSQMCDRDRCNAPCRKKLKCNHTCPGLCGELCPTLCRVCDREQLCEVFFGTENDPNARFIMLADCGHVFEVSALDTWMEIRLEDGIALKQCPKCRAPIRRTLRYGNITKSLLSDVSAVKRKVNSRLGMRKQKVNLHEQCSDLFRREMNLSDSVVPSQHGFPQVEDLKKQSYVRTLLSSPVLSIRFVALAFSCDNMIELSLLSNQFATWRSMWLLRREMESVWKTHRYIALGRDLEEYLVQRLSRQQYDQAVTEFRRLEVYAHTYKSKCELLRCREKGVDNSTLDVDVHNLGFFLDLFESSEVIPNDELRHIEEKVNYVRELWGLGRLTVAEKLMARNAIGLGKGHWFKCPQGHFYAIGECGGAMEKGKCPDCGDDIGGTSHTLAPGNTHASDFDESPYAAYSNEASKDMAIR